MTEKTNIYLDAQKVSKSYFIGKKEIKVLQDVDWHVKRGSWTALLGASGSGKTTLLNLLGTLEKPDSGTILCEGVDYKALSRYQASQFRNSSIGFIFQSYQMLPELTILENVYLPSMIASISSQEYKLRAEELLSKVGLSDRLKHRPNELSGGEQQRVAIARALINNPSLILADEPTGNLDSKTGHAIVDIFNDLHEEGRTIVMITHDPNIAAELPRQIYMQDGALVDKFRLAS